MTDKQVIDYLLKFEQTKTYAQISRGTGRSIEDLKEIYSEKVMPILATSDKPTAVRNDTGEKYISLRKDNGKYVFSKGFATLEEAIKARDKVVKGF